MEYIPRENPGEGYGVGFFPILEVPGQAQIKDIVFPSSRTLETELCSALRAAVPATTVKVEDFQNIWEEDRCPDGNGSINLRWPNPGKDLSGKRKDNTGKLSHHLDFLSLS